MADESSKAQPGRAPGGKPDHGGPHGPPPRKYGPEHGEGSRSPPPHLRHGSSQHGHAPHLQPSSRRGHWVLLGVLALAVVAGGVFFALSGGGSAPKPDAQLIAEMKMAAQGRVLSPHVFGGPLAVRQVGDRTTVTADDIPPRDCVSVGWTLARDGVLAVNGLFEPRLSPAVLSRLCYTNQKGASLAWTPYPKRR
jgi:hypothetical protein